MTDSSNDDQGLLPRLRVIEQQPLSARAQAYGALHEELARRLDAAPTRTDAAALRAPDDRAQ